MKKPYRPTFRHTAWPVSLRGPLGGRYLVTTVWAILELGLSAKELEALMTGELYEVRGYTLLKKPEEPTKLNLLRERNREQQANQP